MFTYVRRSMFFLFVFFFLLIIGCDGIQSEEAGDQSAEHKRLLLNNPQAMNDRFIDIERKLQAVNGKVTALERENSLLKSTMTANTQTTNSQVFSLESENNLLKSTMAANTKTTNSKFETIKSQLANGGGVVYIRWGRKDCPLLNGTQLVYSGIAGGGQYYESGSGSTYLCLPHDPDVASSNFPHSLDSMSYVARVWGAEYQFSYGNAKVDDDVPCATCLDTKAVTFMMIPGKSSCPAGWRKQYSGHLCANHYAHPAASEYACVDDDPQYFEGRRQNSDGKLFYPAVTVCGSLPCPPYENSKYLKCVICTK